MIRIVPAFLALAAFAAAPAAAEQRRFSVTDFDRIIVEGPYVVHLVVGRTSSATVTGSREAIDRVTVDAQGRMLRIRRNRNAWGGTPGADVGPVIVALEARSLRSARLIGPARLQVDGAEGLNVEFSVEGSGSLRATGVDAETLSLALAGSGRLDIAGATRRLHANFQGTGDVEAANLRVQNATVATTTVGNVTLTVDGPVTVNAGGLGEVEIRGRATCTLRGSGAGQVRCSNQR